MFENQPKGLFALALANTGERFGYYTMLAVFALFLRANYGLSPAMAGTIYSSFLMLVYVVFWLISSVSERWLPQVSSLCLPAICCCRCPLVAIP